MRIKRRHRQTNLRILVSHLAFIRGHIGTALQNLRRNSGGNRRRHSIERRTRKAERRCCVAREYGDRMFILRPLLQNKLKLRCGRIEQRRLLRDLQAICDAAFMTVVDQIQSFLLDFNRLPHHSRLAVEFAQIEIVSRQFRAQYQPDIFQVSCALLQRSVRSLKITAHASEQIKLVANGKRHGKSVLCNRCQWNRGTGKRTVSGEARARSTRICIDRRKERRRCDLRLCARFGESIARRRQRLVRLQQLLLELIELSVMKDLPPRSFGNRILRSRRLPGLLALPRIGNRRSRALILGPDGTAQSHCEQQDSKPQNAEPTTETRRHGKVRSRNFLDNSQSFYKKQIKNSLFSVPEPALSVAKGCLRGGFKEFHERASPALGLATFTFCPSSSESEGLMTIRSLTSSPPRISSVAPKSRPIVIGRKCTVLSLSTKATRGPSARNNMALTGIVIRGTEVPVAKCTSPKEPGNSLPSLFGTSTSVFKVRVPGSMTSAVRATVPVNFCPGNSCSVTFAFMPTLMFGAYACGTLIYTRSGSTRAMSNSSLPAAPAPELMSAPGSTLRRVITP